MVSGKHSSDLEMSNPRTYHNLVQTHVRLTAQCTHDKTDCILDHDNGVLQSQMISFIVIT
jgi:hypothetical protein